MTAALPHDVIGQLTALGTQIGPPLIQGSWALLTPFHEKLGYLAPRIDRDRRYGEHERHRLDVHAAGDGDASGPGGPAPVLLFVHGGGFVGGDKHQPGTPAYDFVGAWAVRNGWLGVTMTYRLAPDHPWPAGAQDVAAAVGWIRAHIAGYGGDPDRIVVAGHSAGAVHVASCLAGHGAAGPGHPAGVRAAALLSGIYDLSFRGEREHAYFGTRPAQEVSTLPALLECEVPLLFSIAEGDPGHFQAQAQGVVDAWQGRHGVLPNIAYVPGHNHISEIGSLGVDEEALGVTLSRFIRRATA